MFFRMAVDKPIPVQTRAYLRGIPGLPLAMQRLMADDAGAHAVYEWGEIKGKDSRAMWMRSLRAGDTAWLPSLQCLVTPPDARPKKYSPTIDLGASVAELTAREVRIVDAKAKIDSASDPAKWAEHVRAAMARASQGERSRRSLMRSLKKARGMGMPGVVARWESEAKAADRERAMVIWTSSMFKSDQAAAAALPEDLQGLSGSTLRRILGPRRPGDAKAGGRPPKSSKRNKARLRYVYFIQRGRTREVKIGSAYDVRARLTILRTSTPDNLRLIGTVVGDNTTEREMHKRFSEYRIRGEWFKMEGELAAFIKALPKPTA